MFAGSNTNSSGPYRETLMFTARNITSRDGDPGVGRVMSATSDTSSTGLGNMAQAWRSTNTRSGESQRVF